MYYLDHIRILCLILENIFSKGYWQTVLWLLEACQDSNIEITGYVQLYIQLFWVNIFVGKVGVGGGLIVEIFL